MKAIFVQSLNGYMAKGPEDDLSWAPLTDKRIFKLLTLAFGGKCVCSDKTFALLPDKMKTDVFRTFIVATPVGCNTLENLNLMYPNAVLLGGPTFLKAAYRAGVIDTFIITTTNNIIEAPEEYKNPFTKILDTCIPMGTVSIEGLKVALYNNYLNNKYIEYLGEV